MKSFKKLISEVAQPKSEDELNFKDKHIVQVSPHPVAADNQHTGDTVDGVVNAKSDRPKRHKRLADYKKGEDMSVYEGMDLDDEDLDKRYARERRKEIRDKIIDEKKLDPVGQEDDDIDNDGDVDDSDRYLHNRRKVIAKAMKESIQNITEKAKSQAQQKAAGVALAVKRGDLPKSALKGASKDMAKMSEKDLEDFASTKHDGLPEKIDESAFVAKAAYSHKAGKKKFKLGGEEYPVTIKKDVADEITEADEDVKWLVTWRKEQGDKYMDASAFFPTEREARMYKGKLKFTPGVLRNSPQMKKIKQTEADKRALANESLDESMAMAAIGRKLQQMAPKEKNDMIANAMANLGDHLESYGTTFGARNMKELEKKTGMTATVIKMLIKRAGGSVNEEVELDEAKKTFRDLAREYEKLTGKKAPSGTSTQAMMIILDKAKREMQNEELELDEAMDYDKMTTAELKAAAQAAIKSGDRNAVKAITAAVNNRIANKGGTPVTKLTTDPKKLDALKKQLYDIKKEEVELAEKLDEAQIDKMKKVSKGFDSRPTAERENDRLVGSKMASHKSYVHKFEDGKFYVVDLKESIDLTENFKTGSVKLDDGSSVIVKKQDADLLNKMFADLNTANKAKMLKVAMADKNGFEEILGFAREAL